VPAPATTNKYQDPAKMADFSALMPADKFVSCFENSVELASILEAKCKLLIEEWHKLNFAPCMADQRTPVDKLFQLFTHTWKNFRGKQEQSSYELQLNSYGYTALNMSAERPTKMTLKDIKVREIRERSKNI
jgi:hypothetical protein